MDSPYIVLINYFYASCRASAWVAFIRLGPPWFGRAACAQGVAVVAPFRPRCRCSGWALKMCIHWSADMVGITHFFRRFVLLAVAVMLAACATGSKPSSTNVELDLHGATAEQPKPAPLPASAPSPSRPLPMSNPPSMSNPAPMRNRRLRPRQT